MSDSGFTDEQIALAHRLYLAGLQRQWQPGDRLMSGERPVLMVHSVSVEGEPYVEVERGGRMQVVTVPQPRVWLPTLDDVIELLTRRGLEGALMFRGPRYGIRFRLIDSSDDYRLITGDSPCTVAYRALVMVFEQDTATTDTWEALPGAEPPVE